MDGAAHTVNYFDTHLHNYSPGRLRYIVETLNGMGTSDQSLVDIGCGTGNILAYLKNATRLQLCGIDASAGCLEKAAEVSGCATLQGSITDAEFIARIGPIFDYAILAAVLHHVIGNTRRESRELAKRAVENSLRLLKPDGVLFILEPTFAPRISMDVVFWIKRTVTTFTSKRVMIGDYWNNIGAPVVSYYGSDELTDLIPDGLQVINKSTSQARTTLLQRLVGLRRGQSVLVIQNTRLTVRSLTGQ